MADTGTEVAGGKYVVPEGVAVEELDGGAKKLANECPPSVQAILAPKGLMLTYEKMVNAIAEEGNTRSVFGNWKSEEFVSVMDLFRDEFADRGIKLVLSKRKSGSGNHRWIEYIDTNVAPDYIPQFDVSNKSGQKIKTIYTTLDFPNGVAVEELKQWGGRKKLRDKIPIYVEKMITEKNLMVEYEMLVESCVNQGVGARSKMWNIEKLKAILEEYRPKFAAKGVAIFVSHKEEYIHHGNSGHTEFFRWIEFVDREQQPDYYPQRDADTKDEKCVIS